MCQGKAISNRPMDEMMDGIQRALADAGTLDVEKGGKEDPTRNEEKESLRQRELSTRREGGHDTVIPGPLQNRR
jgi:hypothetical protein